MRYLPIILLLASPCFGALAITADNTTLGSIYQPVLMYVTGYQATTSDFVWDFGDGFANYPEVGMSVLHYYQRPGTYTVTVTETDSTSTTYTATASITVNGSVPKLQPRPSRDPVLWLKFEDDLTDSSGNGNNGSVGAGTVTYAAAGAENKCLDLTAGGNCYVTIPDSATLDGFTSGLTISFWAKQNGTKDASGYVVSKASCYRCEISYASSAWTLGANVYAGVTASPKVELSATSSFPPMSSGGWHHYVLVYNNTGSDLDGIANGKVGFYIDGVYRLDSANNNKTCTGNIVNNGNALTIGAAASSWEGYVDEVKIWNYPLTKNEISIGFDSFHAPFYNREKQYVYFQIPGDITETATNTLTVVLTGTGVNDTLLNAQASLTAEYPLLIDWSTYNSNTFTLTSTLKNAGGTTLESITEYFTKGYNGVSRVSIDENNNIKVNGAKVFPIGSWIGNATSWHIQPTRANVAFGQAVAYSPFTEAVWQSTINTFNARGQAAIGPVVVTDALTPSPRSPIENMLLSMQDTYYDNIYTGLTNPYSIWGWCWDDEPDLKPGTGKTRYAKINGSTFNVSDFSPSTVASWSHYGHTKDPQVPQIINTTGTSYQNTYGTGTTIQYDGSYSYSRLGNMYRLGSHKSISDVFCIDIYPYDWHYTYTTSNAIDLTAVDNLTLAEPYVPKMFFVENYDIGNGATPTPAPTQAEMEHLVWLHIIHGAKGICWFPQHVGSPPSGHNADPSSPVEDISGPIFAKITDLKEMILSTAGGVTCTDNRNTWAANGTDQRVDTLVRVYGGYTWIIAARLTEVGDTEGTATCTFTESGGTTGSAAVYGEGRQIEMTDGSWTDTFGLNAVHIYQLSGEAPVEQLPPVLAFVPNKTFTVGTAVTGFSLVGTDVNGDTLTYSIANAPTWMSLNTSTGAITGTPTAPGTWTVTATVSDGTATDSVTFTVTVYTGGSVYLLF